MLRCAGLLADIAAQLLPRQTGNDLRHCDHLLRHMHLAGRYELVAASLCRSFRPRSRNRTQECHRPSFCSRMRTVSHPGWACHDVVSAHKSLFLDLQIDCSVRQIFTAFGIMLGYVMDLAFFHVPNKPHITGLNWRLMLGSVSLRRS